MTSLVCHDDAMELNTYVRQLHDQLLAVAETGDQEARAFVERLVVALDPAARLALLDALSAATGEITRELAPGSVELRLRSGEPEFAVTLPPAAEAEPEPAPDVPDDSGEEGSMVRLNLRLSEQLKARIERAAARQGRSANAWLIRAATAALRAEERDGGPTSIRHGMGRRHTGWAR